MFIDKYIAPFPKKSRQNINNQLFYFENKRIFMSKFNSSKDFSEIKKFLCISSELIDKNKQKSIPNAGIF